MSMDSGLEFPFLHLESMHPGRIVHLHDERTVFYVECRCVPGDLFSGEEVPVEDDPMHADRFFNGMLLQDGVENPADVLRPLSGAPLPFQRECLRR
jgi:hypothetical protein